VLVLKTLKKHSVRRLFALSAVGALAISSVFVGGESVFASDPLCGPKVGGVHQVSTPTQLQAVGSAGAGTGDCGLGASYLQINDITLTSAWTPVSQTGFTGTYDGGNFSITGLQVNGGGASNQGMFRNVSGTVTKVNLVGASVSATNGTLGTLVGFLSETGVVSYSHASGSASGAGNLGGLVGVSMGSISHSSAAVTVSGSDSYVGGLLGQNEGGTVSDSSATGSVTSTSTDVGGLVGYSWDNSVAGGGAISASSATGPVQGDGTVGGLVGQLNGSTIQNSFSVGDPTGVNRVGGFVGRNRGTIQNSFSVGHPTGVNRVGGFVAHNAEGTIQNSFSVGDPTGQFRVGGFVGHNEATITNSYSVGMVNGTEDVTTGGLVGENQGGNINNSFWDTETSTISTSNGGTGKTTLEMQTPATFTTATWSITSASAFGFDRTGSNFVWGIGSGLNCGYPFVYWQTESVLSCGPSPTAGPVAASAPVAAPVSNYFIAVGFDKGKAKLKKPMRAFIRKELNSRSGEVRAVCVGTVRGKKWTPKREALALARAASGCGYVTKLNPGLPVELKKRLIAKGKGNPLTVRIRVFY
jgi:hypothetical protein